MMSFLQNISPVEIIIILAVIALLFGSKIMSSVARSGGETVKEIKNIKKSFTEPLEDSKEKTKKED